MMRIVVDTNVLVSACIGRGGASKVIEACLRRQLQPLLSVALYLEYDDVLSRDELFNRARLDKQERIDVLDAFIDECLRVKIRFLWRPNLRDEGDNHLVDLAVAGDARYIVTSNIRDFAGAQLKFSQGEIITPESLVREFSL